MSIINHKEGEWGPFSPDLVVLSSMSFINQMVLDEDISFEKLEEYFYNPRTLSALENLGCADRVIRLFEQGMVFNDIFEDDAELAKKSVQRVLQECIFILKSEFY